ncbi:MAG: hypothetical protein ABIQ18_06785 [Umezawaea sp.]
MARTPCPEHGVVVVYLNPDVQSPTAFLRGLVVGPPVVDPHTDHDWVPVLRPDRAVHLVDTATIARVLPAWRAPA